jgi:hypothetical protein
MARQGAFSACKLRGEHTMRSGKGATRRPADSDMTDAPFEFPTSGLLETTEQIRRFELLRLAFFVLKLRKLDEREADEAYLELKELEYECEFYRNLLRHVIFQQMITLTRLDAREQALQIIAACR